MKLDRESITYEAPLFKVYEVKIRGNVLTTVSPNQINDATVDEDEFSVS